MSYDLKCPYCDAELDVCHDDGFGYEEGVSHQMDCDKCGKSFIFQTSISFYYEPEKADCLNGSEHDYKPTNTNPVPWTKMRCIMCDGERELTEEERIKLNIPTQKSYFESLKTQS